MFNRKSFAIVTRFFNIIIEKFFNMISFIHLDSVRTKNKNQILKNLTIVVKFLFLFFLQNTANTFKEQLLVIACFEKSLFGEFKEDS